MKDNQLPAAELNESLEKLYEIGGVESLIL